jgi:hypothetical protein
LVNYIFTTTAQSFIIENNQTHPSATITKIHPSGQPLKNKKVSYVTKDEISKYADGGSMAEGGEMSNRRTLRLSDAVLYRGEMYTLIKRNNQIGLISYDQGAWGSDQKFIPLSKLFRSDLEENLTDMKGNKFNIPSYDELMKQPYGFMAKGGEMGKIDEVDSDEIDKAFSNFEDFANGGSMKLDWEKADVGDSALVIAENKMGVIVKTYGRRFHLRFPDGSDKTYSAEDLKFFFDEEYAEGGRMAHGGAIKGSNPKTGEKFDVVEESLKKEDGLTSVIIHSSYSARISSYELRFDENGFLSAIGEFGNTLDGTLPEMNKSLKVKSINASDKKESIDAIAKITSPSFAKKVYDYIQKQTMAKGGEIKSTEKLPYKLDKYFIKGAKTIEVPLSQLYPLRARETGIENAEKFMRMAYNGDMERRKPISIYLMSKGKYKIADGNSTFAVAKKNGWKTIYADVIKNPKSQSNGQKSVFSIAKEIRKDGESWQSAIQRAKMMK